MVIPCMVILILAYTMADISDTVDISQPNCNNYVATIFLKQNLIKSLKIKYAHSTNPDEVSINFRKYWTLDVVSESCETECSIEYSSSNYPCGTMDKCSGACTDTNNDVANCGSCSTACKFDQICKEGLCQDPPQCEIPFKRCLGSFECDTNVGQDAQNCGSCGNVCPNSSTGEVVKCQNSTCVLICNDDFSDCDKNITNGCEVHLGDIYTCGSCSRDCFTPSSANMTVIQPECSKNFINNTFDCEVSETDNPCDYRLQRCVNGLSCVVLPNNTFYCGACCGTRISCLLNESVVCPENSTCCETTACCYSNQTCEFGACYDNVIEPVVNCTLECGQVLESHPNATCAIDMGNEVHCGLCCKQDGLCDYNDNGDSFCEISSLNISAPSCCELYEGSKSCCPGGSVCVPEPDYNRITLGYKNLCLNSTDICGSVQCTSAPYSLCVEINNGPACVSCCPIQFGIGNCSLNSSASDYCAQNDPGNQSPPSNFSTCCPTGINSDMLYTYSCCENYETCLGNPVVSETTKPFVCKLKGNECLDVMCPLGESCNYNPDTTQLSCLPLL